jgi:hypothetical protein
MNIKQRACAFKSRKDDMSHPIKGFRSLDTRYLKPVVSHRDSSCRRWSYRPGGVVIMGSHE